MGKKLYGNKFKIKFCGDEIVLFVITFENYQNRLH